MKTIEIIKNSVKETVVERPAAFASGIIFSLAMELYATMTVSPRVLPFTAFLGTTLLCIAGDASLSLGNKIKRRGIKGQQYFYQSMLRGCLVGSAFAFTLHAATNNNLGMPKWLSFNNAGHELTIKAATQIRSLVKKQYIQPVLPA